MTKKVQFKYLIIIIMVVLLSNIFSEKKVYAQDATQGEIKNFLSWQLSEIDDSLTISFLDGYTQTFQKGKCNIDGIEIISESECNVDDIFDSEQNKVMVEWLMNHPLEEIAFSDNVEDIGLTFNTYFWNTANKITFGKKVRNIGDYAFGYSEIDVLNLPNSLISIGKGSFEGCVNLHSVVFPESLNIIKEGAFHACLNLTDVTVLSKQVILEDYCFGFSNLGIPLDNMIIRGYKNSTAETYANENGFTFIALDDGPDTTTTTTDVTTTTTTNSTETISGTATTTESEITSTSTTIETTSLSSDTTTETNPTTTTTATNITETTTGTTTTSDVVSTATTTESEITSTSTTVKTTFSSSDTTTETNPTTTTTTVDTILPQTGYSDIYKVVIILAVLMTVSGVAIVVKTKKETE